MFLSGNHNFVNNLQHLNPVPEVSVVGEVDLVRTEKARRLYLAEKLSFSSRLETPECESIVDEGDHWPDEEEGEGDWEGARVKAVHHRAP